MRGGQEPAPRRQSRHLDPDEASHQNKRHDEQPTNDLHDPILEAQEFKTERNSTPLLRAR